MAEKEKYYMISCSEDGDVRVNEMTKDQLLKRLKESETEGDALKFMEKLNDATDPMYWGDGKLLIKGTIVVPKAVEVTTKFDID